MSTSQDDLKTLLIAGKGAEAREILDRHGKRAAAKFAEIRQDDTLSETGKRQRLAQAAHAARTAADREIADLAAKTYTGDIADASAVFGTKGLPGDSASLQISRRDASDRVAGLAGDDLRDMLARATRTGDEVLARATAERALQLGDADTLNRFTDDRPQLEDAVERLWNRERADASTMEFALLKLAFKPDEFKSMDQVRSEAAA